MLTRNTLIRMNPSISRQLNSHATDGGLTETELGIREDLQKAYRCIRTNRKEFPSKISSVSRRIGKYTGTLKPYFTDFVKSAREMAREL